MDTIVLDACAIIAFLRNENGADKIESLLLNERCTAHAINLCEVYKDCLFRGESVKIADQLLNDLYSIGIISCEDMDEEFWKHTAKLKAKIRQISYADCFALALSIRAGGTLYTSDHHEFDKISDKYSIEFIR
ncbi:MAG: type II toxin-antitoxin system VapC family toxin [Deltaproteobacteria bacterium]|nr:MAG: type II toxin-antitoxin system VapC family toxin [Deltaproteobacteria bacterium]